VPVDLSFHLPTAGVVNSVELLVEASRGLINLNRGDSCDFLTQFALLLDTVDICRQHVLSASTFERQAKFSFPLTVLSTLRVPLSLSNGALGTNRAFGAQRQAGFMG
jgi:hypothetical protein